MGRKEALLLLRALSLSTAAMTIFHLSWLILFLGMIFQSYLPFCFFFWVGGSLIDFYLTWRARRILRWFQNLS